MNENKYRYELDLNAVANEYAKKIQKEVDEMALDKASDVLAKFGYMKVVRCRNCESMRDWLDEEKMGFDVAEFTDGWCMLLRIGVDNEGFCAWGERRGSVE